MRSYVPHVCAAAPPPRPPPSLSSRSSSSYKSSVRLLVGWNVIVTVLIVGGSVWRMTALTWYHFLPAVVLAVGSLALNLSTLVY